MARVRSVTVLLDVGVAGVVVDHAVQVDVADSGPLLSAGQVADAGDRMPRAVEARQAGDVDVKQGSRPRPLIAAVGLPGALASLGEAVAVKHLPDRRASLATDSRQATGTEVGLPASAQDRLLLGRAQPPRLTVRARGAIPQPGSRSALRSSAKRQRCRPTVGRGRRHTEGGSCRLLRHLRLDRLHQREPARWSESSVSVNLHPGPPWLGRQNHKPLGGPGCLSGVHNVCGRVN